MEMSNGLANIPVFNRPHIQGDQLRSDRKTLSNISSDFVPKSDQKLPSMEQNRTSKTTLNFTDIKTSTQKPSEPRHDAHLLSIRKHRSSFTSTSSAGSPLSKRHKYDSDGTLRTEISTSRTFPLRKKYSRIVQQSSHGNEFPSSVSKQTTIGIASEGKNKSPCFPARRRLKAGSINMFNSAPSNQTNLNKTSIGVSDLTHLSSSSIGASGKEVFVHDGYLFSSPEKSPSIKHKKQVAFSSEPESPSSSPLKNNKGEPKSILKLPGSEYVSKSFITLETMLNLDLSKNESWPPGVILQIPSNHPNIKKKVHECALGLIDKQFHKQYQVYASLNHMIKENPKVTYGENIFTKDIVRNIIASVQLELLKLLKEFKEGSNPFQQRTASQGLKLIVFLNPLATNLSGLGILFDICTDLLKSENISKGVTSSVFQFVKVLPEKYYGKMESIGTSIVQMKHFTSASVTCEKLNILRRFVILQPVTMSKCSYQIISYVLFTILNTDVQAYQKVLNSAISVLTCLANNKESKAMVVRILSEELESSFSSIKTSTEIQLHSRMTIAQAICETLKYLIHINYSVQAAKIWTYLLYLVSFNRKKFILENWDSYIYFEPVFRELLENPDTVIIALESWKVMVYNFQTLTIKDWETEQLKHKLNSLLFPFFNTKLIVGGTKLKQWSNHQSYVILYARIYYAMRLKMEEITFGPHLALLLDHVLTPLYSLTEWDTTFSYILKSVFLSDRYLHVEDPNACFWFSEFEKWKGRLLPLPKMIFRNPEVFSVILRYNTTTGSSRSFNILQSTINISVYYPLENLKLACPYKEYCQFACSVGEAILEIFEHHIYQNRSADELFSLVKDMDDSTKFVKRDTENHTALLMTRVINKISKTGNDAILLSFLALCFRSCDRIKLFYCCMVSDIFDNASLINHFQEKIDTFILFLNYAENLEKIEIPESEQIKMVSNFEKMMMVFDNQSYSILFPKYISFLKNCRVLCTVTDELKFRMLLAILKLNKKCSGDIDKFCEQTPIDFLQSGLRFFDNETEDYDHALELVEFLRSFRNIESIPQSWLDEISYKLGLLVHPEIEFDTELHDKLKIIGSRLSLKESNRIKKLAIRRKVNHSPLIADSISGFSDNINRKKKVDYELSKDDTSNDTITSKSVSTPIDLKAINKIDSSSSKKPRNMERESEHRDKTINKNSFVRENSNFGEAPIPIRNLKSFIIDSINIEEEIGELPTVRVPSSSPKPNISQEEHTSPAKRTRSRQNVELSSIESLDEWTARLRMKTRKDRRENKKESPENSGVGSQSGSGTCKSEETKSLLTQTDMDQFKVLLKKFNSRPFFVTQEEKDELESSILSLLLKLKHQ